MENIIRLVELPLFISALAVPVAYVVGVKWAMRHGVVDDRYFSFRNWLDDGPLK